MIIIQEKTLIFIVQEEAPESLRFCRMNLLVIWIGPRTAEAPDTYHQALVDYGLNKILMYSGTGASRLIKDT